MVLNRRIILKLIHIVTAVCAMLGFFAILGLAGGYGEGLPYMLPVMISTGLCIVISWVTYCPRTAGITIAVGIRNVMVYCIIVLVKWTGGRRLRGYINLCRLAGDSYFDIWMRLNVNNKGGR